MSTFQGDLAHGKRCGHGRWLSAALAAGAFVCVTCPSWPAAADGRSTNIALDHSGSLLFVANRLADSLTVFEVNGSSLEKLTEVGVGNEPICVAVAGKTAYVANAESGTVSVVEETGGGFAVVEEIEVGTEPRGCALGAGGRLFVTNFTEGTVAVVDTGSGEVEDVIDVGGNPYGVTTVGHNVFVTQFFARLIDGGPGEGFDDGKEGVLLRLRANNPDQIKEIILSPLADSGFTANRVNLCTNLNPLAVNDTFCPDPTVTDPTDPAITMDPQAVHPNQLKTALACKGFLYLPNVGAQPEPPVQFTTNVQALVHVVSIGALAERKGRTVNLNQQIALEEEPDDPTSSLARLFGNELVAIDADSDCKNFFLVSRGGNYVIKARLVGGKLNIDAPDNVVRFQTGNIPTGIDVDDKGRYGYVNNEANMSVSVLDLESGQVVERDVPSSTPPDPGSFNHVRLVGFVKFFTALGVPNDGLVGTPAREIVPLADRGKQSNSAWSSCGSCHDEGLADGVTWIFGDGPRQTIPMHALYSKPNGAHDIRINNWSAARDSGTDFNNNSIGVQGGIGFVDDPATVFDHGISNGASEALDFETTWLQTIRTLNAPEADNPNEGADVFEENCASCHGGAKWTKSQVIYLNNPALNAPFAAGGVARDPGLTITANQAVEYNDAVLGRSLRFLEDVGTFDPNNDIEIRQNGQTPLGVDGFNVPSVLGVGDTAPYFHNGSAQTLEDVFDMHLLPGGGTITDLGQNDALFAFLEALDGSTALFRSETNDFQNPLP